MSDYLEEKLLDHVFRDIAYTKPTTIAIALCIAAPVDSDTGDLTGKEVTGNGYARTVLGPGVDWAAVVNGTTKNSAAITFPAATGDWTGPITHVAIVDDSTIGQGNLLFHGALTDPKTVVSGSIFSFEIDQLTVQIDN